MLEDILGSAEQVSLDDMAKLKHRFEYDPFYHNRLPKDNFSYETLFGVYFAYHQAEESGADPQVLQLIDQLGKYYVTEGHGILLDSKIQQTFEALLDAEYLTQFDQSVREFAENAKLKISQTIGISDIDKQTLRHHISHGNQRMTGAYERMLRNYLPSSQIQIPDDSLYGRLIASEPTMDEDELLKLKQTNPDLDPMIFAHQVAVRALKGEDSTAAEEYSKLAFGALSGSEADRTVPFLQRYRRANEGTNVGNALLAARGYYEGFVNGKLRSGMDAETLNQATYLQSISNSMAALQDNMYKK